jgi:hypothetical protein
MNDNLKPDIEIISPTGALTPREAARAVWVEARARFDAAHRAAAQCLDRMSEVPIPDSITADNPASSISGDRPDQKARQSLLNRMENRALLLADALQRHALINIIDTRMALDDIARAAAEGGHVGAKTTEEDR